MKRLSTLPAVASVAALLAIGAALAVGAAPGAAPASTTAVSASIVPHVADLSSVQHIVVVFPENHSFDN